MVSDMNATNDTNPNEDHTGAGTQADWPGRDAGAPATAPVEGPPVAPVEAAPVGLTAAATGPDADSPAPPVDWQDRFERERRRSRVFMATTAVAGALVVGSLFYVSAQGSSPDSAAMMGPEMQDNGGMGREMAPGMPGQDGDARGPGRRGDSHPRGFGGAVEQLFNADGSLDTEAVEQFKERIAGLDAEGKQALAQHIAWDVVRGHLTQEQADELLAALDLEAADTGVDSGADTGSTT